MRNKQNGRATLANFAYPLHALVHKGGISSSKRLIDDENLRIHADGGSERQSCLHSAGIGPKGLVNNFAKLAKTDDPRNFRLNFGPGHSQAHPAQYDVVAPRNIRMEPRAQFKDSGQTTKDLGTPRRRIEKTCNDFKKRALSCAIRANYPDDTPALNLERNIS